MLNNNQFTIKLNLNLVALDGRDNFAKKHSEISGHFYTNMKPILTNQTQKRLVDNKLQQLFDAINQNNTFQVKSLLEMNIDKVS